MQDKALDEKGGEAVNVVESFDGGGQMQWARTLAPKRSGLTMRAKPTARQLSQFSVACERDGHGGVVAQRRPERERKKGKGRGDGQGDKRATCLTCSVRLA